MVDHHPMIAPLLTSWRCRIAQLDVVVVGAGFAGMYMLHRLRELGFSTARLRGRRATSAAPGTGTATRAPAATSRASTTRTRSTPSSSRSGSGPSATRPSPRSCATPTTSPTASTCAATSSSTPGSRAPCSTRRPTAGRSTDRRAATRRSRPASSCWPSAACRRPRTPRSPGLDTFAGPTYHTGRWPHEGVDFTGQRVGVIGTGSSGDPVDPADRRAGRPPHRLPADAELHDAGAATRRSTPSVVRRRKADYRQHREQAKHVSGSASCSTSPRTWRVEADPAEREARFRAGWERGFAVRLIRGASATCCSTGRPTRWRPSSSASRSASIVDDPEVAEALSPRNYPFGTKRPCLDTGYYATFNRPNVTLVDLRATPIVEITPAGVAHGRAASYELDAIVFATGFDAMTGALLGIDIRRARRAAAAGEVGGRAADLPRAGDGRLPQPVHDHRAGQPVGAVQHDGVDRAARGLDRRLPRDAARARRDDDRGDGGRRGRLGRPRQRGRRRRRCSRGPTPGTWAPTCPASPGCSCPTSAASASTGRSATPSPPRTTTASTSGDRFTSGYRSHGRPRSGRKRHAWS